MEHGAEPLGRCFSKVPHGLRSCWALKVKLSLFLAMRWLVGVGLVLLGLCIGTGGMHCIRISELRKLRGLPMEGGAWKCPFPYRIQAFSYEI